MKKQCVGFKPLFANVSMQLQFKLESVVQQQDNNPFPALDYKDLVPKDYLAHCETNMWRNDELSSIMS